MIKFYWWRFRQNFKIKPKEEPVSKQVNAIVEQQSTKIINIVGYIILFLTLLDYVILFFDSELFNPIWGWEAAGKLVETAWGSLLGFLLIFYRRDRDFIKPKELTFLALLSWLALFMGILYFAIAPTIIGNAFRINRTQQAQITAQIDRQKEQVQQYTQQLDLAGEAQLNNLLQAYQQQAPELASTSSSQLKENLLTQARQQQQQNQKQLVNSFSKHQKKLVKTTLKWIIGAVVCGMTFILIWINTQWTRILRFYDN